MRHLNSSSLNDHRADNTPDVVCFSHLRWYFVFQRPQHLLTRCARDRRVFYIEEPIVTEGVVPRLDTHARGSITVVVPQLPPGSAETHDALQRRLLDAFFVRHD